MTEQKEYVQDLEGLHISHQGEINENNIVMSRCGTFFRPAALPDSAYIHSCPCNLPTLQDELTLGPDQEVSGEFPGT